MVYLMKPSGVVGAGAVSDVLSLVQLKSNSVTAHKNGIRMVILDLGLK